MKFNKKEILRKAPEKARKCLDHILDRIEWDYKECGEYASIEDFIRRMFNMELDIHAFSVISEYVPMEFPGNGDATMLRQVLALMGYDPDYSEAPDTSNYFHYNRSVFGDDEELPFQ